MCPPCRPRSTAWPPVCLRNIERVGGAADRRVIEVLTAAIVALLVVGVGGAAAMAPSEEESTLPAVQSAAATTSTTLAAVGAAPAPTDPGRASESSPSAGPQPATPPVTYTAPPPPIGWKVVGKSVQGRPILMKRFGHGPKKVVWLGGIHGDEIEGSVATANLPAAFAAAHLENKVTLVVIWDANPD